MNVADLPELHVGIAASYAGQLRLAADDPKTTPATMREAMRDAANVMDTHMDLIALQQTWLHQQKFQIGVAISLAIVALVLALGTFGLWLTS
jgi:hypothetical protein